MTAVVPFNRVKFTAASGGTGAFVFGAPIIGFRSPVGLIPDGTPVSVTAQSSDNTQWETVHGAWHSASSSISRDLVFENSAGTGIAQGGNGSPLNFSSAPIVLIDYLAQDVSRIPSGGDLTFYIATTGSDSNSGTSATTPFATLQRAMNVACGYRYSGATLTFQMSDGTYANQNGMALNLTDAGRINIYGNNASPGNVKFTDPNGNGILYVGSPGLAQSSFYVQGITFDSTYQGIGNYSGFLRFGNCQFEDSISGGIIAVGTYNFGFSQCPFGNGFHITILSNFYELFQVELGYVELQGGDTTLTLPVNASVGFCTVELNNDSTLSWGFASVVNGSTLSGQALRLASNCHSGNVAVNGGNANGIPGNSGIGLYDETCTLTVGGTSTKGGHFFWNKAGDAVPGDIMPFTYSVYKNNTIGQCYIAVNDNGVIKETPIPINQPATGNLSFYVATTGSDSNPGTASLPFATVQRAVGVAASFDYQDQYIPTINIGAGTFSSSSPILLPPLKNLGPNSYAQITGTGSTTIIFDNASGDCFYAQGSPCQWKVSNLAVDTLAYAFSAESGPVLWCSGSLWFNNSRNAGGVRMFNSAGDATIFADASVTINATKMYAFAEAGSSTPSAFQFVGSVTLPGGAMTGNQAWFINFNGFGSIYWNPSGVTNPSSWTGAQITFGNGSPTAITTIDATLNSVPGVASGNSYDDTCTIGNANTGATNYFYTPNAGPPSTTLVPSPTSFVITKDTTNGQRYLSMNDGGTIYSKQIGRSVSTETGTTYTTKTSDIDGRIEMNNAAANTLTVDTNANMPCPVGTEIRVVQVGAGATTIAAAGGVTGDNFGVVGGQWKSVLLYKRATNEWVQTNV
jgi:hypothetical protein